MLMVALKDSGLSGILQLFSKDTDLGISMQKQAMWICVSLDSNNFPWGPWTWACCSYLQARKWPGGFAYLGFLVQGRPFVPFAMKKHLSYSTICLLVLILCSMTPNQDKC
jgi:hypothetical protein